MALADEAELEQELDRLYALPLAEFTAARDELARRARAEGQRAIAARLKELRKPTLPAWVVNQLTRQRELDVQRLIKAGETLTNAQIEAIAARDRERLLEARREEQKTLERLAAAGREILEGSGRPDTGIERVLSTLRAASLTPEGRELLESGRLTHELSPPGFEALAGLPLPRSTGPRSKPTHSKDEQRGATREARDRASDLKRRLRELERKSREAARLMQRARAELEAAEAEADAIEKERRETAAKLAAETHEAEAAEPRTSSAPISRPSGRRDRGR